MQALNPDRIVAERKFVSSLGLRRLEEYEPSAPGHKHVAMSKLVTDPYTKIRYIPVIDYFVMRVGSHIVCQFQRMVLTWCRARS